MTPTFDGGNVHELSWLAGWDNAVLGLTFDQRYTVERRLGEGGMGDVFLAQDARLGRAVAMKILAEDISGGKWITRFQEEIRTLSRFEHPGIVPIYDIGTLPDGRMYYTMKFLEGRTFEDLIEAETMRERLVSLLIDACEIVQYAHERNVVHRDLKPVNIMVDDPGQVYVIDWGISKVLDEIRADDAMALTTTGTVLGTLAYMPPEQAGAQRDRINERSDIYSLGAILFEILSGEPPGAPEILKRITPPPGTPGELAAVLLRATEPEQERRYPSAAEMAADLRRALTGRPVAGWRRILRKIFLLDRGT